MEQFQARRPIDETIIVYKTVDIEIHLTILQIMSKNNGAYTI